MRLRSIPVLAVSHLLLGVLQAFSPVPSTAAGESTKRTLKTARELFEAGRLEGSLAAYETLLAAGGDVTGAEIRGRQGKARNEALYRSSLILLASDEPSGETAVARVRLDESRAAGLDPERDLAAKAIVSLLAERDAADTEIDRLRRELQSERATAAELLDSKESEIEAMALEKTDLEALIEGLREEQREGVARLAWASGELASCEVERELLTDQLALTQVDQTRMLESALRKNKELSKQAGELSRLRSELDERSAELAEKEAELAAREELIREVTDTILEDGESGEGG